MNLIHRHDRAILGFLNSESRRSFLVSGIASALLLGSLGLILLRVGAPIMNGRPWDVPLCLDGAWRVANGQVPHRDFFSHLGPLSFYLVRFGMWGGQPHVSSIIHGTVCLMVLMSALAFGVLWRRTSAWYGLLLSCFLALLIVTPRPMGDPYDLIDHAMVYNRIGDAFLILFSMLLFLPIRPGTESRSMDLYETGLAGLLGAAMLMTKFSYAIFAAGFVTVALGLGFWRPVRILGLMVCGAGFGWLALAWSGVPLGSMFSDLKLVTASQDTSFRVTTLAIQMAKMGVPMALLGVLAAETVSGQTGAAFGRFNRFRPWIVVVVFSFIAAAVLSSNCQASEVPLLSVAGMFCVEHIRRQALAGDLQAVRCVIACGLLICLLWPTLGTDVASIRHVVRASARHEVVRCPNLATTNLKDFRFGATENRSLYSEEYAAWLDEGIELLGRQTNATSKLAVVLYSNPFHIALGLTPPKGGTICWLWYAWDKTEHVSLSRLLGEGTHVLSTSDCKELKGTYGKEWDALQPQLIEETRHFSLWKLKEQ